MATASRILFVSGEVAPFTKDSATALLARHIPERICESGAYETRIMMPRYGIISERKNRLHEVIRLSGTDIPVNGSVETLKVKVASIPGIRLQVYFMDNAALFKRKGIAAGRDGVTFEDNPERALFFGRAVLETIRKLGWRPDVVHGLGWMSAFLPFLLKTEYAADELLAGVPTVFTPDAMPFSAPLSAERCETLHLDVDPALHGGELVDLGRASADAIVWAGERPDGELGEVVSADAEAETDVLCGVYDTLIEAVPA